MIDGMPVYGRAYQNTTKGETQMEYQHPEYLVETDWLHTHLADANLRVLDFIRVSP